MTLDDQEAAQAADDAAKAADDEFDKAFDEFAEKAAASPEDDDLRSTPQPDEDDGTTSQEPAGGQDEGKDTASTTTTGEDGAQKQEDDIWAGASEEQRAAFEAAQKALNDERHKENSAQGRLRSYMTENADLRQQLEAATAAPAAAADEGAGEGKGDDDLDDKGKATDGPLGSEAWKGFQAEYPEVAEPVAALVGDLLDKNRTLERRLEGLDAKEAERDSETETERLLEAHPDFSDIAETDDFANWLAEKPAFMRQAAVRNASAIVDADEAAELLSAYKTDRGITRPDPGKGDGGETEPSAETEAKDNADKTQSALADRRRRQLAASASTDSKSGVGPGEGPADDFDAAFDYYAAQPAKAG